MNLYFVGILLVIGIIAAIFGEIKDRKKDKDNK